MEPKWNVKNDYLKPCVEVMGINGTKVECKVVLRPPESAGFLTLMKS